MSKRTRWLLAALSLTLLVGAAACGDDDGADVRDVGGTGTGSASGSASGTGSGSGSASGVASGECHTEGTASGSPVGEVHVVLDEYSIDVQDEVPAGIVTFEAMNEGDEAHELVIIAGDSPDLPTDDDGAVDESQLPSGALIGEIEPFASGDECSGTFELDAGSYVLLCNIVEEEDGETEAHYTEGMVAVIDVG